MKKRAVILLITLLVTTLIPFPTPGTASLRGTGAGTGTDTGSYFRIHFLDVGQGDCAVVQCDGEAMVIDGVPKSASRTVYTYIRETLCLTHIDYIVSTHPHQAVLNRLARLNCTVLRTDELGTVVLQSDGKTVFIG